MPPIDKKTRWDQFNVSRPAAHLDLNEMFSSNSIIDYFNNGGGGIKVRLGKHPKGTVWHGGINNPVNTFYSDTFTMP